VTTRILNVPGTGIGAGANHRRSAKMPMARVVSEQIGSSPPCCTRFSRKFASSTLKHA